LINVTSTGDEIMNYKVKKTMLYILLSILILGKPLVSNHQHDDSCGYDVETNSGCTYERENTYPAIRVLEEKDGGG